MKIDAVIRDALEKEMEHNRGATPPFSARAMPATVPAGSAPGTGKRGGKRWWLLAAALFAAALLSMVSHRTGLFRSSLAAPWAEIVKLTPEKLLEALSGFLRAINSSL